MDLKEIDRSDTLATREWLAKRFKEMFFTGSHIRYNPDSRKFESKYGANDILDKVVIKTNNHFDFFVAGFSEAELLIRMENEE